MFAYQHPFNAPSPSLSLCFFSRKHKKIVITAPGGGTWHLVRCILFSPFFLRAPSQHTAFHPVSQTHADTFNWVVLLKLQIKSTYFDHVLARTQNKHESHTPDVGFFFCSVALCQSPIWRRLSLKGCLLPTAFPRITWWVSGGHLRWGERFSRQPQRHPGDERNLKGLKYSFSFSKTSKF